MSKDDFLKLLKDKGYNAERINGCITVISADHKTFAEVADIAETAGYTASFGWRKEGYEDRIHGDH